MLFTNTYMYTYSCVCKLIFINKSYKETEHMLFCLDKHLLKPHIFSDSFGLNLDSIEKRKTSFAEKRQTVCNER